MLRAACSLMVRLYAMRGGVTNHTDAQTEWSSYQSLTILPLHPGNLINFPVCFRDADTPVLCAPGKGNRA
jgi:hypothetical protein